MNCKLIAVALFAPFLALDAAVVSSSATDASATASVGDDLLQTSLASTTWPTSNNINNGTTGAYDANDGVNPASTTAPGTKDFVLDLSANPLGYDISEINSYTGWSDGRAGQAYTIFFSYVGDPAFTQITPSEVSVAASGQSLVTHVFDDTTALLGTGVDVVRFEVGVNWNNNVWREIDVIGEATIGSIDSFVATPDEIASGSPVTLSWKFDSNVSSATIDQGVGNILPLSTNGSGSVVLDPGPSVNTTYELSVINGGVPETKSVTVIINNNPNIFSFEADQTSVTPGTDVTLTWNVADFDTLYLNGTLLEGIGNSIVVSPFLQTSYTLEASNSFSTVNATLIIEVLNAPVVTGVSARFIEVIKNTSVDRLHLSEIEVFVHGVTPDGADGDGTSSNNLVLSASPSVVIPPTTTGADLNEVHTGVPVDVYDGDLESGAAVWSTND
ncbi:MAG: hypothetical protein NWQ04_05930, partial [Opitutales bacterium]|nr:hypothetical protein [Opitutales bacterium]